MNVLNFQPSAACTESGYEVLSEALLAHQAQVLAEQLPELWAGQHDKHIAIWISAANPHTSDRLQPGRACSNRFV